MLYTDDGPTPGENLMHTVSFYRKSKPVQVSLHFLGIEIPKST